MIPTARVESDAKAYAESKAANIKNPEDKALAMEQAQEYYLDDSISDESILNLGFKSYTYEELKRGQLSLGLDLKGGMSVVLQVNLKDLVVTLSKESSDSIFRKAIDNARKAQNSAQGDFVTLFGREYEKLAQGKPLARLFIASDKMSGITVSSTNEQVLAAIRKEASQTVENTYNLLKKRIDKFGVVSPTVYLDKSTDRITVELPGVQSPKRARKLLQATANLEFWEMYRAVDLLGSRTEGPYVQLNNALKTNKKYNDKAKEKPVLDSTQLAQIEKIKSDTALAQTKKDSMIAAIDPSQVKDTSDVGPLFTALSVMPPQDENDPFYGFVKISDTAKVMAMLNSDEAKRIIPRDVRFLWGSNVEKAKETGAKMLQIFAINTRGEKKATLTGERITSTSVSTSSKGGLDYAVSLEMDKEGTRLWKKMTEANVKRCVAVVLDEKVQSWPRVNEVIPNGRTQISGNFSATDANDLANVLSIGKLPASPEIIEESVVGPSLGQATINAGLLSLLIGFLVVLAFMLFYYAFSGFLAVVTLFLNIFIIIGCLASFGTVLTLSGIAGIVLTIGMAVDANVIIFERIREELRKTNDWKKGVIDGFKSSYSSIIDANVTTFVTALILFQYGLGPIKGFATVLAIGVVSSVFTAVLVGRLLFDFYIVRNKEVSVWTSSTKNVLAEPKINFMGLRKICYTISAVLVIAGVVSIFTRGFELGVDFQGGRSYIVEFPKDVNVTELKSQLVKSLDGYENNSVKTFGKGNQAKITTSYMQNSEKEASAVDAIVLDKIYQTCKNYSGSSVADSVFAAGKPQGIEQSGLYLLASSKVGPTIADDIRQSAFLASALALAFIFIYILIRFRKWQFSFGAIIALFHDVLVVMGLFSLLRGFTTFSLEVDQQFVAAILTIIGYSINDTVIVYDRIREEATLTPGDSLKDVVNRSINNTLSRTSFTSLTTFFVVMFLFFFGGDGIAGFAFALFIGIIAGTYSSIFIASPLVVDTSKDTSAFAFREDNEVDIRGEENITVEPTTEEPKV